MFEMLSFMLLVNLRTAFADAPAAREIKIHQIAKTFSLQTDPKIIKDLQRAPWKAKKYQIESINVNKGDTIVFHNSDNFVHNVFSNFFDLKTQNPEKSSNVLFDKVGTYDVQCAIHPAMKLKVVVGEKK